MYNVTKSLPRLAPPPSPDEKVGGEPVNEANIHAHSNLQSHMDTAHVELGTVYDLHVLSMCMCLSRQYSSTAVTCSCYQKHISGIGPT